MRTLLFTGNGKGKTTAAFGMVMRAIGHGQKVIVVQFLKSNDQSGELKACRQFAGVEVVQMGRGFVPAPDAPGYQQHVNAAQQALQFCQSTLEDAHHELVVLDEICGAVARGLIDDSAVVAMLQNQRRRATVVLTGRHATASLIEQADTVTEMHCVRHAYQSGTRAQKGVEF